MTTLLAEMAVTDVPAETTEPTPPKRKALTRDQTASSVRWSFAGLAGSELTRVLFGLILAAWLGPRNYGIVGQATVYVALTSLFLDQGFSATLIRRATLRLDHKRTIAALSLICATACAALTFFLSPLVADFFHTPELSDVLKVLSLTVLLKGLTVVPHALLIRDMRFKRTTIGEVTAAVVGGAAGLFAASMGAEYWSFVVMTVVFDSIVFLNCAIAAHPPLPIWSQKAFREVFSFGANAMGFQVLNYASRNLDNVVIGRALGPVALAHYSLAYRVMMLPIISLGRVVSRVALPVFSRLQNERDRLRRQYVLGTQMLAVAAFPPMTALIVVAPVLIPLMLGDVWEPAVLPLQILAFTGMRQAVGVLSGNVLLACGRADWQFRFGIFATAMSVTSFIIGVHWGVVGVATAYTIASLILMPIMASLVGRLIDLSVARWLLSLVPAIGSSAVGGLAGAVVVWAVERGDLSPWIALFGGGLTVIAVFFVTFWLVWRSTAHEAYDVAMLMLKRRRQASA